MPGNKHFGQNMFFWLLQSAKVFNYAKWEATTNAIFVLFAVVFNVTRLVYYPFWWVSCRFSFFSCKDNACYDCKMPVAVSVIFSLGFENMPDVIVFYPSTEIHVSKIPECSAPALHL